MSVETQFLAALQRFLDRRFSGRARLEDCVMISGRLSPVYRVRLVSADSALPATLIVKRLGDPWFGDMERSDSPPEFREEVAAYLYLEANAPGFGRRPQLVGTAPEGLLVLEDLGTEDCRVYALAEVAPMVAGLLAELHAATWRRLAGLAAARAAVGLGAEPDLRYDGEAAAETRFRHGAAMVADWAETLAVAPASRVASLTEALDRAIRQPRFEALIHDDLANARQCVLRDGVLMLIDFEAAKPGHALRDLAKIMLGKFERDLETAHMVWVNPDFPPETVGTYRAALLRLGGPAFPDEEWEQALAAVMVHAALMQIGSLLMLIGGTLVAGDFLPNLRGLLARLEALLTGSTAQLELRSVLAGVAARCR